MVTSFGWCWCSGETPQSADCWSSCNVWGNIGVGGTEGNSGIVMEKVCGDDMRNLGGGLVLMLMGAGILVGGVVVVVLCVMVMVEVGMVSFPEGRCLLVAEVECLDVGCGLVGGDVLNFGVGFVAVVVVVMETVMGGSKLQVVAAVRIVCSCVNGKPYSLWCLSRKSLEGKMSNVGGGFFGVVMWADSLMECCLWEVTGSIANVVVVEMVVGVVKSVVMADSGMLLEVVMVQLIV